MTIKLACFDLDGTLIDETKSIWQTVHESIGTDDETRKRIMESFYNNDITYEEWAMHDVSEWSEKGLDRKCLLEIISKFRKMPGADELLDELHKRGIKTAVISGSLRIVLDSFFPKHHFDDVFINELTYDASGKVTGVKATEYDREGKAIALREICEREGIALSETLFVGDEKNDVEIAKEAGLSVAFNSGSEELRETANAIIDEKNLMLVLDLINERAD